MRLLLISALAEVHAFFGLRHHYPLAASGPADRRGTPRDDAGLEIMDLSSGPAGLSPDMLRDVPGSPGEILAHLTGTSPGMAVVAEELQRRSIPYVYTPLPAREPSWLARAGAIFRGYDMKPARRAIAAGARVVLEGASDVPLPEIDPMEPKTGPSSAEAGRGGLIALFGDELSPEWNTMRFLAAMEKINADAVIVAGRTDTAFHRECLDRARANPRVSIRLFERGEAGDRGGTGPFEILRSAAVLADASPEGMAGPLILAAARRGIPSVLAAGVFAGETGEAVQRFDPSSWELLHHALTSALNRALADRTGAGPGVPAPSSNETIAASLREVYRRAAAL